MTRVRDHIARLQRRHPRLFAYRPAAGGVMNALLAALGVAALIDLEAIVEAVRSVLRPFFWWLPEIHPPSVHLDLPAWLAGVMAYSEFWWPVLVGLALTGWQLRKRRREEPAALGA